MANDPKTAPHIRPLAAAMCATALTFAGPVRAAGTDAELVATIGAIQAAIPHLTAFGGSFPAGLATLHRMAPDAPWHWQADIPVVGVDQCLLVLAQPLPAETRIVVTFTGDPSAPNIEAGDVMWLRAAGPAALCRTDRGWGPPAKVRLGLRSPERPSI